MAIGKALDRYLADGLLERRDTADNKGRWFKLTPKGEQAVLKDALLLQNIVPYAAGPVFIPAKPLEKVETATRGDYRGLLDFLRSVRADLGGGLAEDSLVAELAKTLTERCGGVAFVIKGRNRKIEASLGLRFDRPWYTREFRLYSVWNVTAPELRGTTGHARSLIIEATKFADQMGRPLIVEELTPRVMDMKKADDPKLRLCGRNLKAMGMVFTHTPESYA